MKPKEKAEELVKKMYAVHSNSASDITLMFAKDCALVAVDEIINTDMLMNEDTYVMTPSYLQYWEQVKQEIETYGGE
jgi:hypothetical protein